MKRRERDWGYEARRVDRFEGVPVHPAVLVCAAYFGDADDGGPEDSRVLVGVGPEDGAPVAYVTLCPCDGVDGLIDDLRRLQAKARPHHGTHDLPHSVRTDEWGLD